MTPDDKRRLAEMPRDSAAGIIGFLRRLLDEATAERDDFRAGFETVERQCRDAGRELRACKAERDAAMAALRRIADAREFVCDGVTAACCYSRATKQIAETTLMVALAAHSAATKPTDLVENESNNAKS